MFRAANLLFNSCVKMIKTCLDTKGFTTKPTQPDAAKISNKIANQSQEISFDEFVAAISNGQTFTMASGFKDCKRAMANCLGLQIFAADIDKDNLSYQQLTKLADAFEARPAIIYESFSSDINTRKWRVIWFAGEVITDPVTCLGKLRRIKEHFKSDAAIVDVARLLYGTTKDKVHLAKEIYDADKIVVKEAAPAKVAIRVVSNQHVANGIEDLSPEQRFNLKYLLDYQIPYFKKAEPGNRLQTLKVFAIKLTALNSISHDFAVDIVESIVNSDEDILATFTRGTKQHYLETFSQLYTWALEHI